MVVCVLLLGVTGCPEFATGFATGAAAIKKMGDDAQAGFIKSVNTLNAEKAKYDALIESIDDAGVREALEALVNEQTREKLNELGKTDWTDPKVVSGYALAAAGLLTAAYQKKRRTAL